MVLGAELLKIHLFCKLFGGSGRGIVEKAFVNFLRMQELEEKFQEYLDGEYKQSEHKQS